MVYTCFICKQRSDKSQDLSFHKFPVDSQNRQEWLDAAGRSGENPKKGAAVCSCHFHRDCFRYGLVNGKRFLKTGSKPTLQLPKQNENSVESSIMHLVEEPLIDRTPDWIPSNYSPQDDAMENSHMAKPETSDKRVLEMPETIGIPRKKIRLNDLTWAEISKSSTSGQVYWEAVKQELNNCQRTIQCLQRTVRRLRQRVKSTKLLMKHLVKKNFLMEKEVKLLRSTMDPAAELIFKSIVSEKKKASEFPLVLRNFAATLLFLSPKAYLYVRKVFTLALPHPSTVRKWIRCIDNRPGISEPALQVLKDKVSHARANGQELLCGITVDDMAIRKHVRWNGKSFSGVVRNPNGCGPKNKEPAMTTQAMVVMVVCLNGHWKIPMAYFFIGSLNGERRADLISQCLKDLHQTGVHVASLTFDGALSNITMAKSLGATVDFNGNSSIYFSHPVTKKPVFVILDACHVIKLVRNALAARKVLYDGDGNAIKWSYFCALVKVQYQYGLHAGTKIRKRHLNWAQEKMNVKLAAQTLSRSVAHALNFLRCVVKHPEFEGSEATENFCLAVNDSFDILNSRQKISKVPSKQCINKDNIQEVRSKVNRLRVYFSSIKDGNQPILKSKRRMGFFGLISALENAVAIFDMWSASTISPLQYLLTYKLSQDHLELFFSAVRSRGGHNNNPTPEQFESAFKWLLVYAQIKGSDSANCISQDDTTLLQTSQKTYSSTSIINSTMACRSVANASASKRNDNMEITEVSLNAMLDHDYCIPFVFANIDKTYINHIVAYISGFVAKSLGRFVKCSQCKKILISKQSRCTIQEKKNQGKLTRASDSVIQVCLIAEQQFRSLNVFKTENVMNVLIRNTLQYIPHTILENNKCCSDDHRLKLLVQILRAFFKVRLHHEGNSKVETEEGLRIRSKNTKLVLFKNQ